MLHTNLSVKIRSFALAVSLLLLTHPANVLAQQDTPDTHTTELEASVSLYQESLAEMRGGYDDSVIETNLDLASALDELERYEEAADAYERAMQGIRIRDGLYGEAQLPLLESAIENASELNDWELVDRNFYIAMSVLEQSVEVTDPRFEQWVRWFASWKISAYRQQIELNEDSIDLMDAVAFYEILEGSLHADDPNFIARKATYTREKGLAHYFNALAISAMPYEEFNSQAPETVSGKQCFVTMRNGQPTTVCSNTQVPNPDFFESRQKAKSDALRGQVQSIMSGYQELLGLLEADPDTKPEVLASTVLELGDMNFMLRNMEQARQHYLRVHEILESAGLTATVGADLTGQPQEIISNIVGAAAYQFSIPAAEPTGFVSFDVLEDGSVRDLVIAGQEADLEQANQELIATQLRMSVYRPRLDSGVPVVSRLEQVPAAEL